MTKPSRCNLSIDDEDDCCVIDDDASYPKFCKRKRKLERSVVRVNPFIFNWSKNRHCEKEHSKPLTQPLVSDTVNKVILDPNQYIIEPETTTVPTLNNYEAFDWTKQLGSDNDQLKIRKRNQTQLPSRNYSLSPRKISNKTSHEITRPSIHLTSTNVSLTDNGNGANTVQLLAQRSENNIDHQSSMKRNHDQLSSDTPLQTKKVDKPSTGSKFCDRHQSQEHNELKINLKNKIAARKTLQQPVSSKTIKNHSQITKIQKNVLHGQGIFSAFHDKHYYRCNICTYKTINSSSLLHHLFTHMFFCTRCCYYTYSRLQYYQHCYTEHAQTTLSLDNTEKNTSTTYDFDLINPIKFGHLYVTRCDDGTFALCVDSSVTINENECQVISSANQPTDYGRKLQTNSTSVESQHKLLTTVPIETYDDNDDNVRLFNVSCDTTPKDINIPSSFQEQSQTNHCQLKQQPSQTDDDDIVVLDNVASLPSSAIEKLSRAYVSMKHRRSFCNEQVTSLESLTLEYDICKEQKIRQMCRTNKQKRRRKGPVLAINTKPLLTNENNEIISCINDIIDSVVNNEENKGTEINIRYPPLVSYLPKKVLASIFSSDDRQILDSLNLINKYDLQINEEKQITSEQALRASKRHVFLLSSPNSTESVASLLSSGSSMATASLYTKIAKLPNNKDNTDKFLRKTIRNSNHQHHVQSQLRSKQKLLSTGASLYAAYKRKQKKKLETSFYSSVKQTNLSSSTSMNYSNPMQQNPQLLPTTTHLKLPTMAHMDNNNQVKSNRQRLNELDEQVIILD